MDEQAVSSRGINVAEMSFMNESRKRGEIRSLNHEQDCLTTAPGVKQVAGRSSAAAEIAPNCAGHVPPLCKYWKKPFTGKPGSVICQRRKTLITVEAEIQKGRQ